MTSASSRWTRVPRAYPYADSIIRSFGEEARRNAVNDSAEFKRSAGEASSVGEFKRDELAYGSTAGDADEFFVQAKRKCLGRVVQVRNLWS